MAGSRGKVDPTKKVDLRRKVGSKVMAGLRGKAVQTAKIGPTAKVDSRAKVGSTPMAG